MPETPMQSENPHSIDLKALFKNGQIQQVSLEDYNRRLLERTDMLDILSGHMLDLAASPIASALIHPEELFMYGSDSLQIVGCVQGERLVDRIIGLQGEQQTDALRLITYILEQEIGQGDPRDALDLAQEFPTKELIQVAKITTHQYGAIASIHQLLTANLGQQYATADPERHDRIQQLLTGSDWEKVRDDIALQFPA